MPPKIDLTQLTTKRDVIVISFNELIKEFLVLFEVEAELSNLEHVYKQIEVKYRAIKEYEELITTKVLEGKITAPEDGDKVLETTKAVGAEVKTVYLNCTKNFARYQKKILSLPKQQDNQSTIDAMSAAIQKMAETMSENSNAKKHSGLEKLPVPTWDGDRKTYATWKHEFNHYMIKYKQDDDEQLQRLRKALPKLSFWTNQIKYSQTIMQAWEILDTEFENKRKLMDDILKDITSLKPIKSDSKSLSRYAAKILSFCNNMKLNGCNVYDSVEAPFVMSQLLSKLECEDNIEFGREMERAKKAENVANLIEWMNKEATLRSRGKTLESKSNVNAADSKPNADENPRKSSAADKNLRETFGKFSEQTSEDNDCPLGCSEAHHLAACPIYQAATIDEKWEIVRRNKRCRKCLRSHHTDRCNKPDGKTCNKCERRHHRSLHSDSFATRPRQQPLNLEAQPFISQSSSSSSHIQGNAKAPGICPVQKVKIKDKNGEHIEVLAMIDSGSNTSFISKNVAKKLKINGCKTHLTMNLAGGKKRSEDSELVNIILVSPEDESIEKHVSVYTIKTPCNPAKTVSIKDVNKYKHLRTIANKLYLSGGTIDLLIGADIAEAFIDVHVLHGDAGEPVAKRYCFGWYLLGQVISIDSSGIHSVDVGTISAVEDIKNLLLQDQLGVKPTKLCTCDDSTLKENKFIKSLADSTEMVDGRIQVRMPWKDTGPPTESNYEIAYSRMISSEKTFLRKDCFDVIQDEVNKLLDQNFVKEIPAEEVKHDSPEWYLPLHAVFTPERSTQVRLVFDASAKGPDGRSLNDHLEKGPNYINSLPSVLIAWRWDKVAYCGDLRKMFNQVMIHPDDQVFHRFLWRTNPTKSPKIYQWIRLNFGDKPAPDIATGTVNYLARQAQGEFPQGAQELLTHMYVDDIGGSQSDEKTVTQVIKEIDSILSTGKFEVKAWHSNAKNVDKTEDESTTFLGYTWNKAKDTFKFKKQKISNNVVQLTKRDCLKNLAQLWDPMGLTMPITIELRIDLQDLWSDGYTWDDILSEDAQDKWKKNIQVLNNLLTFEFKRQLRPDGAVGKPEIHGFSDGGEKAYGAAIFLRWKLADGSYSCIPLMIKAFVAPLKKKSIPRLELMGCLALTRLYTSCREALKFADVESFKKIFWIDSQTVLAWIKTPPKRFKPFVSVRVAEIQESVDTSNFRYIQSCDNPADVLTRGINESQLEEWMKGAPFLYLPEKEWPVHQGADKEIDSSEIKTEKRPKSKNKVSCHTMTSDKNPIIGHLLKCSTFSRARRLLAYILRFTQNAKTKEKKTGPLSVNELQKSEKLMFRLIQIDIDVNTLDKKLLAKEDEHGILRAHGRLENVRTLPEDMRNPVILPKNHKLVKLLLKYLHEKRGHCGYKSLIHEARRKYWIIGVRSMAKDLTTSCTTCRKLRRKPLEQLMGQIPVIRVAVGNPAFMCTALDMFGPLHIRLNRKTLKEAQVIIFTCTTTRAIHLELVTDRSTESFLMAFRRFASTRGHPKICWSDCGTNFVGAQPYLKEIMKGWDMSTIQMAIAEEFNCQFRWDWNIPRGSHMNGVVESLIKSVRQALDVTCRNQTFTEEQWRTFLAETTYVVNSRPLYPSSENIWEEPPITPNDLLIGPHCSLPVPVPEDKINPRHLMKTVQQRIQQFWVAWQKYFAPQLLPRNKWFRVRENLKPGDIVLESEATPQRRWKMALVEEVYPGNDGLVRKVKIKTPKGTFDRPIHKLCLIATKEELENSG